MRTFLVANPKGGCGKSTVAVHLASWFARHDNIVYLGDLDRQQSSRQWLEVRPDHLPSIRHWDLDSKEEIGEPPPDADFAIIDTPAGLHGKALRKILSEVDRIVVPVSPSRFDMLASRDFFEELGEIKAIRKEKVGVAIVAMRTDLRTHTTQQLIEFLQQFDLPLITCLRNTQRYVQAIDAGASLFDHQSTDPTDRTQWQPLLDWLIRRQA